MCDWIIGNTLYERYIAIIYAYAAALMLFGALCWTSYMWTVYQPCFVLLVSVGSVTYWYGRKHCA